ncbi:MAG: hypothetical protein JXA09_17155 [Anaerolineae bacterium]|nr:hypothetical protein [Anaerolineae bacterium]
MDMREVVAGGLSGFEKLVAKIPGYSGYKQKEMRREADKLLRDTIYRALSEQRRRVEDIQSTLGLEYLEYVERIGTARRRLQTLADTVHTAAYGYAGLFDAVKVKEEQLDALYEFDNSLLEQADAISACIDSLQTAADEGEGLTGAIRDLTETITQLQDLYNRRRDVLTGMA